ncbi:ProQ/FINO family protein [Halomonas alkalisoli]|uniref:ProQ/FINO family protein n=1 Tax=Halomonas alkalisoli TaxID=2907158 RepID=UPI001F2B9F3A|nr:ProQ/FINO family protein [Halomonas alkalisoli]MCE9680882.1 ProQ/FinO family protein [Halomonas alkalisoli]
MIDERSLRLLNDLEVCADTALGELHGSRERIRELQGRVAELEAARRELEAARLELEEENRELDEQNRELEEDNARLRERLRKGEPAPTFPGASRRAQGLAALIGHRPRDAAPVEQDPESQDTKAQDTKAQDTKAQDTKAQDTKAQDTKAQDTKAQGERQAQLPIEQAPSAEALLAEWYRRYPDTFFKGHTRPLKVGIHQDLAAREPWPEKLVRRALAGYVNLPRYLKAVREGAQRIDLAGQPDGSVDAQAAEHAHRKLERLQAERRQRGQAAGPGRQRGEKAAKGSRGSSKGGSARGEAPDARSTPREPPSPAPAPSTPAPSAPASRADPEARMEAKLSALLAKHNGQGQGR